jgi:hypothetical protein
MRRSVVMLMSLLVATFAAAQPLKPPDLSSPRATLRTFLESGDDLGVFLAQGICPPPHARNSVARCRSFAASRKPWI